MGDGGGACGNANSLEIGDNASALVAEVSPQFDDDTTREKSILSASGISAI